MFSFKNIFSLSAVVLFMNVRYVSSEESSKKDGTLFKYYLEDNLSRLLITTEDNGNLSDCYLSGDEYIIAISLQSARDSKITKVNRRKMNALVEYCTYAKWSRKVGSSGKDMYKRMGQASAFLIYPGTKWCGAGNVSDSYDDLGPERETDMCCREHDHCDDSIEKYSSKYGLDNNGPFTKSHCRCDDKFYDCLRDVDNTSSNRVGKIYFNYIRMECFKYEYPSTCSKYKGFFRPRCVEYESDRSQPPEWQWFDAKEYIPITEEKKKFNSNKQDAFEYALLLDTLYDYNMTEVLLSEYFNNVVNSAAENDVIKMPKKLNGKLKLEKSEKNERAALNSLYNDVRDLKTF